MSDLDVEVETPIGRGLMRGDARREAARQRQPKQTPAPQHQPQAVLVHDQRQAKTKGSEALAQEPLEAAAPLFLKTGKPMRLRTTAEGPLPTLAPALGIKSHRDRNLTAFRRKAHEPRHQAGEDAAATIDNGAALREACA